MGGSRKTVEKCLKELETGIVCVDNYKARGRKKTETQLPHFEEDICNLIDGNSQTDPTFQSTLCYSRISAIRISTHSRKRLFRFTMTNSPNNW